MPAPVPPGFTRGPLLFLGATTDPAAEFALRQWVWRESGGYGARLVLITVERAQIPALSTLREHFAEWECDHIGEIVALDRTAARNPVHVPLVEQATGIVLLGSDPGQMAATLGGTALAQAIRRANAHSKLVAALGAAGAFLCQHMVTPVHTTGAHPATLRGLVAFGPGLGLVNRLVVDATSPASAHASAPQTRLLAAVASNPFLIGVAIAPGSAAILYPDNTLQANGYSLVTVVDGHAIHAADLEGESEDAIEGALCHTLHTGDGFNLDDHTLRPVGEIDLPPTGPVTSVF